MFIEVKNIEGPLSARARLSIKNLLEAHYFGHHYVFFNVYPESINVQDFEFAGEFALVALHEIMSEYTEVASILEVLKIRAVVDFSLSHSDFFINQLKSEINLPYEKLNLPKRLMPTQVIFEDESESEFYSKIISLFDSSELYDMKYICYEAIHGGGSRTFGEFDKRKRAMVPTLCIVDSDKKHPLSARGSTSSKFPKDRELIEYWAKYLVLNCHEIENLIPLNFLEKIAQSDIEILRKLFELDSQYLDFTDLKEGIKVDEASSIDKGRKPFWTKKIVKKLHFSLCNKCNFEEGLICEEYLLPPLGPSIMDDLKDYLDKQPRRAAANALEGGCSVELKDIVQNIRDWCFARQRSDFA